jgi:hypothetical protein
MKKLPPDVKHATQQAIHLEDSVAATRRSIGLSGLIKRRIPRFYIGG